MCYWIGRDWPFIREPRFLPSITVRKLQTRTLTFAIDEAGSGEDVALCLHGFPESRFSWRHQLPFLADRGWHAVAPDLRGYGETERPTPVAAYRIEHLVDDTAAMSTRSGHDGGCWSGMIGAL